MAAPVIEQAVVDQIRGIAANPDVVAEVVRQLDDQRVAGIEGLEREKRVMEKDLQHLGEEIAGLVRMNGKLATDRMADLQDRAAVLERQLREVRDRLAESVGQTVDIASVRKTLREFDGVWSEMTPREQEKFVKTLVERVSYDGATGTVTVGFRTAGIRQLCLEVMRNK
jgi:site-specific DNA recombinase